MNREVPAGARLAGFAVALAAAFGAAYGVGGLVGAAEPESVRASGPHAAAADNPGTAAPAAAPLPGLAVSQDGYTLRPAATILRPGPSTPFTFTITGPAGRPLTAYDPTHERDLHLVVVRRDLAGFQHVHPARGQDGRWSVPLDLFDAGTHRVFADFAPAGREPLTLGTDISVPGPFAPVPLPAPAPTTVVDGYTVALAGEPRAGVESALTFTVSRDGRPVTDLQPHLGAFGHLVALRAGDLAYLHTHPAEEAGDGATGGPDVRFATTFPTDGAYRLHLDFRVGEQVRTAAFTVEVPTASAATAEPTEPAPAEHAH